MTQAGPEPTARGPLFDAVRNLAIFLVWVAWIPGVCAYHAWLWTWHFICMKRWRQVAGVLILVAITLAGIRLVPVIYGRYALVYEAQHLASTSEGRTPDEMCLKLRREAFKLGFTDVFSQSEAFTIEETVSPDGISLCIIAMDFHHRIPLAGSIGFPVRIHARVERAVRPTLPKPASLDELVVVE